MFKTEQVDSSVVSKYFWSGANNILTVIFNTGAVWMYKDFTQQDLEALETAESKGSHFNTHIRNTKPSQCLYKVTD